MERYRRFRAHQPDGQRTVFPATAITNIHGNGHTVRYKADLAANQWLGGKTWKLADGGTLSPE